VTSRPPRGHEIGRSRVVAYRLRANHLTRRLPAGSFAEAARYGLQDTVPRAALLSLHARISGVRPEDWEDPSLVQIWGPRTAVYVIPAADRAVFSIGRWPRDGDAQRAVAVAVEDLRRALAGRPRRKQELIRDLGGPRAMGSGFRAAIGGAIVVRWDTRDTVVRAVDPPPADPEAARRELCRRHLRAFGPSTPRVFAWWAGVDPRDAAETWRALAPELLAVEVEGHPAWILEADAPALKQAKAVTGVRFLPSEELKLLGQDRTGLFAGPGRVGPRPPFDWNHPSGLLVDGRLVGSWGRRGGRIDVRLWRPLSPKAKAAVEAEARTFPIPDAEISVQIAEGPAPGAAGQPPRGKGAA
jgi:hypothetical protein